MPGLVKVGKTTRLPSERVSELSGVTGVATPFIVAFEQSFADCDIAEDYVHAELERRGFRQSQNREFFRAPTNDVIRIVLQAPGLYDGSDLLSDDAAEDEDADLLTGGPDEDGLTLEPAKPRKPWDDLLEQADNYYYEFGDTIEDPQEALKLYRDAARLGSGKAYQQIGRIYRNGEGVKEDPFKALEFFKEGTKRGNYFCHGEMAIIFYAERKFENVDKCWNNFFRYLQLNPPNSRDDFRDLFSAFSFIIFQIMDSGNSTKFIEAMKPYAQEYISDLDKSLDRVIADSGKDDYVAKSLTAKRQWAVKNLVPQPATRPESKFDGGGLLPTLRNWLRGQ
jgi:hypothetical protein